MRHGSQQEADKTNARFRGGNNRPLARTEGGELAYAKLLFDTIRRLKTKEARRFEAERVALFNRWKRWIVTIAPLAESLGCSPLYNLTHQDRFREALEQRPPVWYPPPRKLTDQELAEQAGRYRIGDEVEKELLRAMGLAGHRRPRIPLDARLGIRDLRAWASEVWTTANPGRKRRQSRPMVLRYYSEVEHFCEKWRLLAWWAVPAIMNSHFLGVALGDNRVLPVLVTEWSGFVDEPLVVPLPGASRWTY